MHLSIIIIAEQDKLRKQAIKSLEIAKINSNVFEFSNQISAQKFTKNHTPDLIISFCAHKSSCTHLKSFCDLCKVIVIVEDKSKAYDYINLNVFGFLLQNYNEQEFGSLLEHVVEQKKLNEKNIFVKAKRKIHRIPYSEIKYIKGAVDYVEIHTQKEKHIVKNSITGINALLCNQQFKKIHRSTIININRINYIHHNTVVIEDEELKISEGYKKEFFNFIEHFPGNKKDNRRTSLDDQFQDFLETQNTVLICTADNKGKLHRFNEAFVNQLGYSRTQLEKINFLDLIHPDDIKHLEKEIEEIYKEKETVNFIVRFRCANKEYKNLSWTAHLNTNNKLMEAICYDVSNMVNAEKMLNQSIQELNQYKFAIDLTAIVAITDTQGKIIYVNDLFCEISKYKREELIGKNHRILNSGYHSKEFFKQMYHTIGKGNVWKRNIKNRAKDGSFYWVNTTIVPLIDSNTGKPFRYLAIRTDITDEINNLEKLIEAESIADIGHFEKNLITNDRIWSENLYRIFKIPFGDTLQNFDFDKIFHPEDWPLIQKSLAEAIAGKHPNNEMMARVLHNDQSITHVFVKVKVSRDSNGKAIKLFGIVVNKTDSIEKERIKIRNIQLQKEKEVAEKTALLKSEFLANMSHEIRTPMNGIIGMIDIIINNTHPSILQMEYLESVKSSSLTLLTVINDILDLSKLDAGKMKIVPSSTNIKKEVQQATALFSSLALEKKVRIDLNFNENIPEFIITDNIRLKQIIANLLSNAIKFSNHDKVGITVSAKSIENNSAEIKFEIKDQGIGIKEEDKKHLFKAFSQLDNSSKKRHEGTGLGLIICKQLSELLGGEIGVESEFGKGSTFWFTIKGPIKTTFKERKDTSSNIAKLPNSFNANVLIVDDKKVNLMVANMIMMNLGCTVKTATNGIEAVDLVQKEKFDLVFMDIQMPEMDGVEATKIIKETVPNPPTIIALTANALSGDREKYISEGMDDYLAKPITKEAVQIVLAKHVS